MKQTLILCVLYAFVAVILSPCEVSAQKETFDIISYNIPKGWKKEIKESATAYSFIDKKDKSWCQVGIYKSTASKGSIEKDFENDWNELVVKTYNITDTPQVSEIQEAGGWKIKVGTGKFTFNKKPAASMLTTFSGYGKCVSIVATTANERYLQDIQNLIASVELSKPDISNSNASTSSVPESLTKNNWKSTQNRKDATGNYAGYSSNVYQFNANGTYQFQNISFQTYAPKYSITDEEGTYEVSVNKITLRPKTSKYHVHQKEKNDPALKSGTLPVENLQYSFEFVTIYNKNRLVLYPATGSETKREGPFNYYYDGKMQKAYLYDASSEVLPKATVNETGSSVKALSQGYAYSTTNFDDGWNATIADDWVTVTKESTTVLLHYGFSMTDDLRTDISNNCFTKIAANRYNIINIYNYPYSVVKDFPYHFLQADAIDKTTGKNVFISFRVIPKNGVAYCHEIITPSKNEFQQQFATMDKIEAMTGYNRFAIGPNDLIGTWQEGSGAFTQYYFVSNGNYAGMDIAVGNIKYIFENGLHYKTDVKAVRNSAYASEKEDGTYNATNWEITTKDQTGKVSSHAAWFEATKGGRILHMQHKQFSSQLFQLGKLK